jgi:hypothetical protein
LFQRKDCDKERKGMERKTFSCLEHYRKMKERNKIGGTHVGKFSPHMETERLRKQEKCAIIMGKCPK